MRTYKPAKHRYLATTGDINPAKYGGGYLVYVKPDGQPGYNRIECVEWDSDEDDATGYLYRVDVPRDVVREYVRSQAWDNGWVKVAKMLESQGRDDGPTVAEWEHVAAHGTVLERARCVVDIANYYGWHELDHYPLIVSRDDIRLRWARVGVGSKARPGYYGCRMPGV